MPRSSLPRGTRAGLLILSALLIACIASLPWTLSRPAGGGGGGAAPRAFERSDPDAALLPPTWAPARPEEQARRAESDRYFVLGSDRLGRDVFSRILLGGTISLCVGVAAALVAVAVGTLYGATAGYLGGRVDAAMMRFVDVLYGLPSVLIVVLLAVAADGIVERSGGTLSTGGSQFLNLLTLLVALAGVTWLTPARVIRGQVMSLRRQPFMEACRVLGLPLWRQFAFHLLPNLAGTIVVYATLAVPAAILSESFLSFLGIGVREPLPSWGNLVSSGLGEINLVRTRWWLIVTPCLCIALTLLSLNFVGEGVRAMLDPRGRVERA